MLEYRENTRPYPGLRPFEYWENEIFFGREEHTNRLLDILQQHNFLAVIGPSGSGKSSLVKAGLLPSLPLGSIGTGSDWRIAVLRPGHRPMRKLANALLRRSVLGLELVGEERIPESELVSTSESALIEAELRRGPLALIQLIADARTRHKGHDPFNLLVLVDQFEEIFTYADADYRQADESEAFVNLLLASRLAKDAQIYIALTMRTDFLGNCVRFLELPDVLNRAQYLTPRLTRNQIQKAITGPAQMFEGDLEPTLVTELINEVSDDPDQLPILQHALSRMWDNAVQRDPENKLINWDDFHAVGGIANALSRHADEVLSTLSPKRIVEDPLAPDQLMAEILFRAITDQRRAEDGGQAVRRPQTLDRIGKWSGKNWQDFKPVIDAFTREGVNFLHINAEFDKDTVVDISHEALIRQWKRLQHWVSQESLFAREFMRLCGRARDWEGAEQSEKGSGALLTGADLVRAVEWQQGYYGDAKSDANWAPNPLWAKRYHSASSAGKAIIFSDVTEYIERSNALVLQTQKREKRIKNILIGALVLAVFSTFVAVGYAVKSQTSQRQTEAALIWSSLDFADAGHEKISNQQAQALLDLAHAEDGKKDVFIHQLFSNQTRAKRFKYQAEAIIHALVGVHPDKRNAIKKVFLAIPHDESTTDSLLIARVLGLVQLEAEVSIEEMLDALGTKFETRNTVGRDLIQSGLIKAIEKVPKDDYIPVVDQFIAASVSPIRVYPDFSDVVQHLSDHAPKKMLHPIIDRYISKINSISDPDLIEGLSDDLSMFATKVIDGPAIEVFEELLQTYLNAKEFAHQNAYIYGLESIAGKLPSSYAEIAIGKLISVFPKAKIGIQKEKVSSAVASCLKNLPESVVVPTFNQYINALHDPAAGDLSLYGDSLVGLADRIAQSQSADAVHQVVDVLQSIGTPAQERNLADALTRLGKKVPEDRLLTTLDRLIDAMHQAKSVDKASFFSSVLTDLADSIPQSAALQVFNKLFDVLQLHNIQGQENELKNALVTVVKKMSEKQSGIAFDKLARAMTNAKDTFQPDFYSTILNALSQSLPNNKVEEAIKVIMLAFQSSGNYIEREDLSQGLANVTQKASEPQVRAIFDYLFSATATRSLDQFCPYNELLVGLAPQLPKSQANAAVGRLIGFLQSSKTCYAPQNIASALKEAVNKVRDDHVFSTFEQLAQAITEAKSSKEASYYGEALAVLSKSISPFEAETVVKRLMAISKNAKDIYLKDYLADALSVVLAKVPKEKVSEIFDYYVKTDKLPKDGNNVLFNQSVLAAVAGSLPQPAVNSAVEKLLAVIPATKNAELRGSLFRLLTEVAKNVPKEQTLLVFERLLEAMNTVQDDEKRLYYSDALLELPVSEANADGIFEPLTNQLQKTKDVFERRNLAKALARIAEKVSTLQRSSASKSLIKLIKGNDDADTLDSLGNALENMIQKAAISDYKTLSALVISEIEDVIPKSTLKGMQELNNLDDSDTGRIVERVKGMSEGYFDTTMQLKTLNRGLEKLVPKLSESDARYFTNKLTGLLQNNTDIGQIDILSQSIALISSRLNSVDAAKLLFNTLNNPLVPREPFIKTLRERFPEAPNETQGYWALIAWGNKKGYVDESLLVF